MTEQKEPDRSEQDCDHAVVISQVLDDGLVAVRTCLDCGERQ